PGASLYELWKYHERVRAVLASDLAEFTESGARGIITGLPIKLSSSKILHWLDRHMGHVAIAPHLLAFDEPYITSYNMTHDFGDTTEKSTSKCASIPSRTIRQFWEALVSVVHGSFEKAESALFLVREREESQAQINPTTPQAETFDVPDANLIIRSSDLVNFRVHKPVLAMASPVFKDLLSLPQPPDGESVDGLPVVQLSEDSDLLKTLVSMLYPLHPVIPKSYEKVLYLLAACQKYEMTAVQSSIRDKVSQGEFPAPYGIEAFSAYAIASGKGLIPEMENAARQTLDHPITFEILGEGLRLSEGWALRDLVNFRKRYRDNLVSCFKSFLDIEESQFNTWTSCASYTFIVRSKSSAGPHLSSGSYHLSRLPMSDPTRNGFLPSWLADLYQDHIYELREAFSKPLFNSRSICRGYLSALQAHIDSDSCVSCTKVHIKKSETLCKGLKGRLTRALNEALSDLISDK
ncbi:hypothetical protein BGY98DRAFT_285047, partial [Russula aff. rugulosa BPL654]